MKKTLIALAALGMVAGAAQASNVTIYGQLQPSYDFMTVKQDGNDVDYTNMNDNASRIGFKGSEDLGNGLQAVFKLESYFNMVDGAGFDGARDTYVGLKGDFGTVMVGNIDSVYKKISAKYDSFSDTIGDYNSIMGARGVTFPDNNKDHNRRNTKTLNYVSPSMSGITVMANYALAGQPDITTNSWGLGATYDCGALNLFAAYERQNNVGAPSIPEFAYKSKAWKVGASYDFGQGTTLKGIYADGELTYVDTIDFGARHIFLGVDHKLNSNTTLMASYIDAGDIDYIPESGAKAWNVGVNYKLSKRTSVQGIYAYLKNDENGLYTNDAGYAGDSDGGAKISGFSVRLQHKF